MPDITVDLAQVNFPYITIRLADHMLTWSQRGKGTTTGGPDYFMNLTHNRIADKSNSGTLQITHAFLPEQSGEQPDKIERWIAESKRKLVFRYGYETIGYGIKMTPWYVAFINDYSINIDSGMIRYDIKFISFAAAFTYTSTKTYTIKENDPHHICHIISQITDDYLKLKDENPVNDETLPLVEYHFNMRYSDKDFEIDESLFTEGETLSISSYSGPFSLIRDIVRRLVNKEDPNVTYKLIIDDYMDDDRPWIWFRIKKVRDSDNPYIFKLGTRDSKVISWSPSYSGAAFLSKAVNKSDSTCKYSTFDEVGQLEFPQEKIGGGDLVKDFNIDTHSNSSLGGLEAYISPEHFLSKLSISEDEYKDAMNYNYGATMEVLGVINDFQVGSTRIEVIPMINNQMHHTGGKYLITGITDTVGSSGFFTSFKLVKVDVRSFSK